jgi:uncharacterized protein (TIGR00369 family)
MTLVEYLNIEYIHLIDTEFEAKMNITQFHSQVFGYLHGGATIAFGETIAGYASKEIIQDNQHAVGKNITANHFKTKKAEGYVLAKGKLMHKGKRTHVWSIEIYDETNELLSYILVVNAII